MPKEKPTHPDQKYIEALLNGDKPLISEIYKKWGPEARRFIVKNSGTAEEAKDVFQDTILELWKRKETLILTVPLGGYLYYIYRSKWFNVLSMDKKTQVTINDLKRYKDNGDISMQFEEVEIFESRFDILKECFEKLPERCQHIINAQYYDKLKGEEIKKKFNFPSIGAVRKAMYDCRESLKKCMMKHSGFSN